MKTLNHIDLEKVTAKLGTKFRYVNIHELIDQLQEIAPLFYVVRGGFCAVGIYANQAVALSRNIIRTFLDLLLYACFFLLVGAVSPIDHRAIPYNFNLAEVFNRTF